MLCRKMSGFRSIFFIIAATFWLPQAFAYGIVGVAAGRGFANTPDLKTLFFSVEKVFPKKIGTRDVLLSAMVFSNFVFQRNDYNNYVVLGVTPAIMFPFYKDRLELGVGLGIGYLSTKDIYPGKHQGSNINFSDTLLQLRIMVQKDFYVFLRVQHFSNAGIRRPNPGLNLAGVGVCFRFK